MQKRTATFLNSLRFNGIATLLISSLFLLGCQKKEAAPAKSENVATPQASSSTTSVPGNGLHIQGKLVEIPGAFPANDLYNYAYVMRYEVVKVISGNFQDKDILVGHYNPRFSRADIKDEKDSVVDGSVTTFEEGAVQDLTLMPMDSVYTGAIEDEFYQDKRPRWFAIRADKE